MFAIPDHVEQAARFLSNGSASVKQKLIMGGKMLWTAAVLADDWPPQLQAKAKEILAPLRKDHTVEKSVAKMDHDTASRCLAQLTRDMAELAAEIEQMRGCLPQ